MVGPVTTDHGPLLSPLPGMAALWEAKTVTGAEQESGRVAATEQASKPVFAGFRPVAVSHPPVSESLREASGQGIDKLR